jgi:hypothetical protein
VITAKNITDEQIRELTSDRDFHVRVLAKLALDEAVTHKPRKVVREARARCAEILNARAVSKAGAK